MTDVDDPEVDRLLCRILAAVSDASIAGLSTDDTTTVLIAVGKHLIAEELADRARRAN